MINNNLGWRFAVAWTLLTILGCGFGSVIARAIAQPLPSSVNNYVGWTVNGACVGLAQWFVLRKHLRAASIWIPVSAVAWLVGQLLFVPGSSVLYGVLTVLTRTGTSFFRGPAIGMAVGIGIGVVQWLWLRREIKRTAWWILATALPWTLFYIPADSGPASPAYAVVLGILTGISTSTVLMWRVVGKPSLSAPRTLTT